MPRRGAGPASPAGAIVFTGSFAGQQGQAERAAAYSASKGALRLFTQSVALELADRGIRVNGVAPAFVESKLGREGLRRTASAQGISVDDAQEQRDSAIPMRRQAEAREVAHAFLYLASEASTYVTGTWLDINGGLVLRSDTRERRIYMDVTAWSPSYRSGLRVRLAQLRSSACSHCASSHVSVSA